MGLRLDMKPRGNVGLGPNVKLGWKSNSNLGLRPDMKLKRNPHLKPSVQPDYKSNLKLIIKLGSNLG